jgi:hypothetical protein
MRTTSCILLVFATLTGAIAQTSTEPVLTREQIVRQLNHDLTNLPTIAPAANGGMALLQCKLHERDVQPSEQCELVDRLVYDFSLVGGGQRVFTGLSINLIQALAGREVEPDALSLLTSSLVDAVAIADQSIRALKPVSDSRAFRDSVMRSYSAMFALGLPEKLAEGILGNFVRNVDRLSGPHDVRPIPPARPY